MSNKKKGRIIVSIHCRMSDDYGFDGYDDDGEEGEDDGNDSLLDLLRKNRAFLMKGDYRLLQELRHVYGDSNEDTESSGTAPSQERKSVSKGGKRLPRAIKNLLDRIE